MMTQIRKNSVVSVAAVLATGLLCPWATLAQDTIFTYQGELKEGGDTAIGSFDMSFSLWNASTDGVQIGSTIDKPGIVVTDGRFSVQLDMGANAFDNRSRWLEITVGGFTLAPRQPITRSPYSIQTRGIFVDDNNKVGIGTTSPAFDFHTKKLALGGSNQPAATLGLQWSQASVPPNEDWLSFRVGGTFLNPVGQDGTHIIRKAGTALHFSVEDTMNSGSLTPQLTLTETGRLGIGTTSPERVLHTVGSVLFEGNPGNPGVTLRNTFEGEITAKFGLSSTALNDGYAYLTDQVNHSTLYLRDRQVGIGTSIPQAKLQVEGGTDKTPSGGGFIVLGSPNGKNISIDDNEIMARNNGATAPLTLNANGGNIAFGGAILIGHTIVTGDTNVSCPAETKVLGGGCRIDGDAEIRASYPSGNTWFCVAGDQSGFIVMEAYAICANVK
ncbi:MAG: hypothetical protein IH987_02675 [Planctomycetes bacterium]|nr:hypothetical protein [Planctomycetota bacterium]